MAPAQQRFDGRDRTGLKVDDRLVLKAELVALDGTFEVFAKVERRALSTGSGLHERGPYQPETHSDTRTDGSFSSGSVRSENTPVR